MGTLEQAIGAELKRLRESRGIGQEAVAAAGQMYGLHWTQATIAAVELGRRQLSLGELALLPRVLKEAGLTDGRVLALSELVPAMDEEVLLSPGLQLPLRVARGLLERENEKAGASTGQVMVVPMKARIIGEAERKAARLLGVTPEAVMAAAKELRWGSLTARRDLQVSWRAKAALKDDPRRLQAIRGHETRRLIEELRMQLKGVAKKKRRSRS